ALAIGSGAENNGSMSTAVGALALADAPFATALGAWASAMEWDATAIGVGATAYYGATALGSGAIAGAASVAIGAYAQTGTWEWDEESGESYYVSAGGTAIGYSAAGTGEQAIALGNYSNATGQQSIAIGFNTLAGSYWDSTLVGDYTTAVGNEAWAIGIGATTFGYNSFAGADRATSLGANAWVLDTATNSVALGHGSLADRPDTISVGAAVDWSPSLDGDGDGIPDGGMIAAFDRQITNVAAGTHDTDAVNLGQLNEAVGQFDAAGANAVRYDDADRGTSTLAGADGTAIAAAAPGEVPRGGGAAADGRKASATTEGRAAAEGRAGDLDGCIGGIGGVAAPAVKYDDADHGTITLAGEDGTVIANVAAGAISAGSGEAVNGSQLHAALDGVAQYLGGGMEVTAFGTLSAPAFMVQGSTYFSVGDALGALDAQISALGQRVDGAAGGTAASDRVAVGGDAPASIGEGTNAVAIGSGATANGENGVAIG